jgi:hypothetical protein
MAPKTEVFMKNMKKFSCLLVLFVLAGALFTACGDDVTDVRNVPDKAPAVTGLTVVVANHAYTISWNAVDGDLGDFSFYYQQENVKEVNEFIRYYADFVSPATYSLEGTVPSGYQDLYGKKARFGVRRNSTIFSSYSAAPSSIVWSDYLMF